MKIYNIYLLILFSFFIISCSKTNNPIASRNEVNHPAGYCKDLGLQIDFEDTCSYNFVVPFLMSFDSVQIIETDLGGYFYVYADSGNFNYWYNYFEKDSTILFITTFSSNSDSLILKFSMTGQNTIDDEVQRFSSISHLHIINIELHPKTVYVHVPENTESKWEDIFSRYNFITNVMIFGVCFDS